MTKNTEPTEIIMVDDRQSSVCCDGGGGPLGHPTVYLPLVGKSFVDCYYCGRRFVKKSYAASVGAEAAVEGS
ncbi:MAG: zinc-finger domain-containing protein [Candidatus Competibacterales bacterium]